MSPIVVVLVIAVLVGFALRGSLRRFERLRIHWWGFAFGGVLLQVLPVPTVGGLDSSVIGTAMLLGSYLLLLVFLTVNRWIPASGIMTIGLVLNLTVVGLNGGMPVNASAIETAGGSASLLAGGASPKHHVAGDDDLLPFLGDIIPVPRPIGVVLSFGDLLLYGGMGWCVVQIMRGRSRENPRPLAMWFPAYRGKHAPAHWRLPARYRADRAEAERSGTAP